MTSMIMQGVIGTCCVQNRCKQQSCAFKVAGTGITIKIYSLENTGKCGKYTNSC